MPLKSHITLLFYCFVFRCAHLTGKNRCNCQNYTALSNAEIHRRSSLISKMIPTSLLFYIFCHSMKIFIEMKMIWNSVFHLQVPRKEGQYFFLLSWFKASLDIVEIMAGNKLCLKGTNTFLSQFPLRRPTGHFTGDLWIRKCSFSQFGRAIKGRVRQCMFAHGMHSNRFRNHYFWLSINVFGGDKKTPFDWCRICLSSPRLWRFSQSLTSKSFPVHCARCSIFVIYLPNPVGCVVASAIKLT